MQLSIFLYIFTGFFITRYLDTVHINFLYILFFCVRHNVEVENLYQFSFCSLSSEFFPCSLCSRPNYNNIIVTVDFLWNMTTNSFKSEFMRHLLATCSLCLIRFPTRCKCDSDTLVVIFIIVF